MEEEIEIQRTFEYDPEISVIRQREMIRGQAAFLEDLPKVIIEFRKIADDVKEELNIALYEKLEVSFSEEHQLYAFCKKFRDAVEDGQAVFDPLDIDDRLSMEMTNNRFTAREARKDVLKDLLPDYEVFPLNPKFTLFVERVLDEVMKFNRTVSLIRSWIQYQVSTDFADCSFIIEIQKEMLFECSSADHESSVYLQALSGFFGARSNIIKTMIENGIVTDFKARATTFDYRKVMELWVALTGLMYSLQFYSRNSIAAFRHSLKSNYESIKLRVEKLKLGLIEEEGIEDED